MSCFDLWRQVGKRVLVRVRLILVAVPVLVLVAFALAARALGFGPRLARPPQRDRAAERLELDVRAAVAERHREALPPLAGVAAAPGSVERKLPL